MVDTKQIILSKTASNCTIAYKIPKRDKKGGQGIIRAFITQEIKNTRKKSGNTVFSGVGLSSSGIYEEPAEYPAIYGGDECRVGARGMQSPSFPTVLPFKAGSLTKDKLSKKKTFSPLSYCFFKSKEKQLVR